MFSVSEAARSLVVDRKTIMDWSYHFSEYLSEGSKPPKGKQRFYTIEDIRVFAYVLLYWEEKPDIEYIKLGLNSQEYYDIEPIDNLIAQIVPIFQEPTEENININSSIIFGGLSALEDMLSLANAFKKSGDMLIEATKDVDYHYDYVNPILFQYRHAVEIYLKSTLEKTIKTHNLLKLYERFEALMKDKHKTEIPDWFKNIVNAFDGVDPHGDIFRYGGDIVKDEILIDMRHLKTMMRWFAESINNIHSRTR